MTNRLDQETEDKRSAEISARLSEMFDGAGGGMQVKTKGQAKADKDAVAHGHSQKLPRKLTRIFFLIGFALATVYKTIKHFFDRLLPDASSSKTASAAKSAAAKVKSAAKPTVTKIMSRVKQVKRTTWIALSGGGVGVVAIAMALLLIVGSPSVSVAVGGQSVGFVADEAELATLVEKVKDELSEENSDATIIIDDQKIALAAEPATINISEGAAKEDLNKAELKENLLANGAVTVSAYIITVDGKTVGTYPSEEDAQSVLDAIITKYTGDINAPYEWAEDVHIVNTSVTPGSFTTTASALEYLLGGDQVVETYKVKAGDTLWDISQKVGKSLDEIAAANPKLDIEDIRLDDEIKLTKLVQHIHVKTFEEVTKTEAVQFKIKKIKSGDLYKGDTKVKKEGTPGERIVTYKITKLNGEQTAKEELTSKTTKKAKTQTVYVGTKAKPAGDFYDDGSGSLSNPMRHMEVSSGYGARRGHQGIDLRNPNGTAIYASASGTVTYAGYDGNYGNVVRISHGGGLSTVYAHCSSMLVKSGQSVKRGQQIAKVGATGRATGYHLHFEVHVNGANRNPLTYL